MNINYLSDFKIIETIQDNYIMPFVWIYSTGNGHEYSATYDGTTWTNCKRLSDQQVLVMFKNHGMGSGKLSVTRLWYLTDADFSTGICNLRTTEQIDIALIQGVTKAITVKNSFAPFYIKGDSGKSAYQEWLEQGHTGTEEDFIKLLTTEINDTLSSKSTEEALSANQGRVLYEMIKDLQCKVNVLENKLAEVVAIPQPTTFTYIGIPITLAKDTNEYTVSGDTIADGVGSYNITYTLKYGYKWSDDTTDPKTVTMSIEENSFIYYGNLPIDTENTYTKMASMSEDEMATKVDSKNVFKVNALSSPLTSYVELPDYGSDCWTFIMTPKEVAGNAKMIDIFGGEFETIDNNTDEGYVIKLFVNEGGDSLRIKY